MAEPLAYTAIAPEGVIPETTIRSESGGMAVPTGFGAGRTGPVDRSVPERTVPRRSVAARHTDFWRMRVVLWVVDSTIAVIGAVTATYLDRPHAVLVAALWGLTMALRATRDGRVSDLADIRPYTKFNLNFVLLATLSAIVISDLWGTRAVLGVSAGMALAGFVSRRVLSRASVRSRLHLDGGESVIVVGNLESVTRTINEWDDIRLVDIVGVCLSESSFGPESVKGIPVLGSVNDVAALARRMRVDVVAIHDVDKLGGLQLAKLQWALEEVGTQMSIITPMTNTVVDRARVRTVGRRLIVDIAYSKPSGIAAAIKGFFDRVLALAALVVAFPVLLVCAVLIKVNSKGPAIFKQTRVRERGRTFTMYKLRTMTEGSEYLQEDLLQLNETGGAGMFKIKEDPRITKVGVWLRRLSLDELPQLWNVLIGDMSLVGPRPAEPAEVASYDQIARRRLAVKPGLTGLWQVSGRSNLSWDETVRIDHDYVDNWRPGRDVTIALRTVKAVLRKDGAY